MTEKDLRTEGDASARESIVESVGESLCVEAGAGTGKTTLLVDRVIKLITDESASLKNIAAITFTEKAAGELKIRIYQKLEDMVESCSSEDERQPLLKALEDLESCQVSTIHSFAANLLRTRPVEAGVDPVFDVADETRMRFIMDDAWRSWLDERLSGEYPLLELAGAFGVTFEKIRELAFRLYSRRDFFERRPRSGPRDPRPIFELLEGARNLVEKATEELKNVLSSYTPPSRDTSLKAINKLFSMWEDLPETGWQEVFVRLLSDLPEPRDTGMKSNWKNAFDLYDRQLETRRGLKESALTTLGELGDLISEGLLDHALEFSLTVDLEKRRRGLLDFEDLLLLARNLLRDHRAVRRDFQDRYHHLLVDEFQDTDPLQAEIVFFLAEDGAESNRWDEVKLRPGKLFLVGDPKQSIYRFRRADIETYSRAKDVLGGEQATRYIDRNFRSVPDVVEWVNDTLSTAMSSPLEEAYQAKYVPLSCSETRRIGTAVRVVHNRDDDKESADTAREKEAAFLATEIRRLVEGGVQVRGDSGDLRPTRYGDIGVLFRFMTGVHIYERVFRAFDIPFRTEGGRNFFNRQEVVDLRNAACAIDDPDDEVSVVGALRSPFFSVSDSELAAHALAGGSFNYLESGSEAGENLDWAFEQLRRLHLDRNDRPVASTLESLVESTRTGEVCAVEGRGEQTIANYSKVIGEAGRLESGEGLTLSSFSSWLADMERERVPAGESPVEETGGEYAHIMSIHKAKGLEFPVVFLAGIGTAPSAGDVQLLARHSTGETGLAIGKLQTENFAALSRWNSESEDAETARLFYVATTRAKDHLVICDFESSGSTSWFKKLLDDTGARSSCTRVEEFVKLSILDAEAAPPTGKPAAGPGRVDISSEERRWLEGITSALERGSAGLVTVTATGAEGILPPAESAFWPGLETGKEVGTALHEIAERLTVGAGREDIRDLVVTRAEAHGVSGFAEQLQHMVDNILESDIQRRAVESESLWRELPFCVRTDKGYTSGAVDLVFVEDGELVIVDYKSDNVAQSGIDRRLESYREQGELYARVLGGILSRGVKDVVFFFAAPGIERSIFSGGKGADS